MPSKQYPKEDKMVRKVRKRTKLGILINLQSEKVLQETRMVADEFVSCSHKKTFISFCLFYVCVGPHVKHRKQKNASFFSGGSWTKTGNLDDSTDE